MLFHVHSAFPSTIAGVGFLGGGGRGRKHVALQPQLLLLLQYLLQSLLGCRIIKEAVERASPIQPQLAY